MPSKISLRSDYEAIQKLRGEVRPPDRLLVHYVLECRLADQLRNAAANERPRIYGEVYDELYSVLDDHPKRTNRRNPGDLKIQRKVEQIAPYLRPDGIFVELGCGDGALSLAVASKMREVIGIDVQDQLVDVATAPANYRFIRSIDGVTLPLAANSVDVVFSDQLMEHLHPDDAYLQLRDIHRILRVGGVYICSTPSSLTGPHDISMYFDDVARGLHLKEYDYRSIRRLFRSAEFKKISFASFTRFGRFPIPGLAGICLEQILQTFPSPARARIGRTRAAARLFGINLVATK